MQISSRFTIAIHMLTCVETFKEDYKVTSDFLASSINVNPVVIRRILSQLRDAGIIEVKRGTGGASVLKPLAEKGIVRIEQDEVYRMSVDGDVIPREELSVLTPVQQRAFEEIKREWDRAAPRPVLIHGITGSGKTQVYMKLIQTVAEKGQQVIVLIPEIALTYQTVRRFYGWFGEKVSVLNSRLSPGERYDQFKRARRGEIQIMVGPRSALFTPFFKSWTYHH